LFGVVCFLRFQIDRAAWYLMSSAHCLSCACSSSVKVGKAKLFDPVLVVG